MDIRRVHGLDRRVSFHRLNWLYQLLSRRAKIMDVAIPATEQVRCRNAIGKIKAQAIPRRRNITVLDGTGR
jgi:hypothetical protein